MSTGLFNIGKMQLTLLIKLYEIFGFWQGEKLFANRHMLLLDNALYSVNILVAR